MSSVTEVSKLIQLDLDGVPSERVAAVKKEVGDYLIEEILRHVGDGKSPVAGESWKKLSQAYADEYKGGNRTPTMQLFGDLLDSLTARDAGGTAIKLGHFGSEQAPKADGHNQHSLEARFWAASRDFPKRRYIPEDGQRFKSSIERGIQEIVDSYRVRREEREGFEVTRISERFTGAGEETADVIRVGIDDLFSDDVIEELYNQALRRRR
jgi:hypothetical protein